MGDMKDKFKGFMKKVNNQLSTSSSGKFKGQGRVLGSSSRPTNPYVNPYKTHNPPSVNSSSSSSNSSNSKPLPEKKVPISDGAPVSKPSLGGQKLSEPSPIPKAESGRDRPVLDGFDPYGSLITTGKRNKNGFELKVFECPVCNCGFSSEEEVSEHIESCIGNSGKIGSGDVGDIGSGGLSVDCEGGVERKGESTNDLEACVGVYLSGNPSEVLVEVVLRLLRNVFKEPENPKFRRIRMGNPKIREAVGDVAGGIELLELVGFELKEEEGEMWAVMEIPSEEGVSVLKETVRLLEQSKSVSAISSAPLEKVEPEKVKKSEPVVIDRQIKVFFSVPERVAARIELPDSFYSLSLEEVRREAETRKKMMADSQLLIPKSLREKQAQAARRKYTRCIIRVQFPDGVVLQGVFSPREPTSALYEFVSSALKQQGLEFQLIHPIPVKRRQIPCFPPPGGKMSTLEEEDLVPSALVKFKPIETDNMVFTGLTNELLEISEPLGSSDC